MASILLEPNDLRTGLLFGLFLFVVFLALALLLRPVAWWVCGRLPLERVADPELRALVALLAYSIVLYVPAGIAVMGIAAAIVTWHLQGGGPG